MITVQPTKLYSLGLRSKKIAKVTDSRRVPGLCASEGAYHVTAKLEYLQGNTDVHFSVTHTSANSCGASVPYPKMFKRMKRASAFHLWDVRYGPMHYKANAAYHIGLGEWSAARDNPAFVRAARQCDPMHDALATFREHIGFGLIENDADRLRGLLQYFAMIDGTNLRNKTDRKRAALYKWLQQRLPAILAAFYTELDNMFGEEWRDKYNSFVGRSILPNQ